MGDVLEVAMTISLQLIDRHVLSGETYPEIHIIVETQRPEDDPDNLRIRFPSRIDRAKAIDRITSMIMQVIERNKGQNVE